MRTAIYGLIVAITAVLSLTVVHAQSPNVPPKAASAEIVGKLNALSPSSGTIRVDGVTYRLAPGFSIVPRPGEETPSALDIATGARVGIEERDGTVIRIHLMDGDN